MKATEGEIPGNGNRPVGTAALPSLIERYRAFQASVVPGVEGLYRSVRAILDSSLAEKASILIIGAGGGREIEALGLSARQYKLVGVDPDVPMLQATQSYVENLQIADRTQLIEGYVQDVPLQLFDAATSLFVMHFVADDDGKRRYLEEVRKRLRPGAAYLHVDVSYDNQQTFASLAGAYAIHAQLGGLEADYTAKLLDRIAAMPVLSNAATVELCAQTGFAPVTRFFQAFWYTGWWLKAV
jgi:tRNA (cmo5U34)-methyltransferase